MKGIRDIKRRIKSVKNTEQITRAMQLVAASKMKRAQDKALASRPYSLLLAEIFGSLLRESGELGKHPLMEKRNIARRGVLVLATDKGLCGALNANLFKKIIEIEGDAAFVCIGKKATQFISRTGRQLLADFTVSDRINFNEVRVAVEFMLDAYKNKQIDTLEIIFTRFVNTLHQEPMCEQLLPLTSFDETLQSFRKRLNVESLHAVDDSREILFEPCMQAIATELPKLFIKQEIYQMLMEAKASEHSARMVAMKSATDNASNLVSSLTLEYNKARQAAITQEILEIAAATSSN
jgi:F-type H+-transporting ATPase subunit gamma